MLYSLYECKQKERRRKISKLQNKPVSGGNRLLNEEGRPSCCLYVDGYRLFHILKPSFSQSLYSLMHRMLEDRREKAINQNIYCDFTTYRKVDNYSIIREQITLKLQHRQITQQHS